MDYVSEKDLIQLNLGAEPSDAQQVDQAIKLINFGKTEAAKTILLDVYQRVPSDYKIQIDCENYTYIKFWDRRHFERYEWWHKKNEPVHQPIKAIPNAYGRACWWLGFIENEEMNFEIALTYLTVGRELEPNNPEFCTEFGCAFMAIGDYDAALMEYRTITGVDPRLMTKYLSKESFGVAVRGTGLAHAYLGNMDEAMEAYHLSNSYEPGNPVAKQLLSHIVMSQYLKKVKE
jgi:tetratricopeptide (TPR) repeat protein